MNSTNIPTYTHVAPNYLPVAVIEERAMYNRIWLEGTLYQRRYKYIPFLKKKQDYCVRGNRLELVHTNIPDIYFCDITSVVQCRTKRCFEIRYHNKKNQMRRLVLHCREERECEEWIESLREAKEVWQQFLHRKCELFCKTFSGDWS